MYSMGLFALAASLAAPCALAQTTEPAQMTGLGNWTTTPLFTVGESLPDGAGGSYTPPGIMDVSKMFGEKKGDLMLFNVQGHSLRGGPIDSLNLAEGGQLLFLSK